MQTTFINNRGIPPQSSHYRTAPTYQPTQHHQQQQQQAARPDVRDDYESAFSSHSLGINIHSILRR